jgi:hypothetical protein
VFREVFLTCLEFMSVWRQVDAEMRRLLEQLADRLAEAVQQTNTLSLFASSLCRSSHSHCFVLQALVTFAFRDGEDTLCADMRALAQQHLVRTHSDHPLTRQFRAKLATWQQLSKADLNVALSAATWNECLELYTHVKGLSSEVNYFFL